MNVTLERLCLEYGVDAWHLRNSQRRPLYQELTALIIARVAQPSEHIVEVGCGIGDVLDLLWQAGFRRLTGLERDEAVWRVARARLATTGSSVFQMSYPCSLPTRPDVLVCVNCVYWAGSKSKQRFLDTIRDWMMCGGEPRGFLIELVHDSYKDMAHSRLPDQPTEFPLSCRVSPSEVAATFTAHSVYVVPSSEPGRIPKALYYIARSLEPGRLDGLMERVC